MEYQSSTTLGSESGWNSYTGETDETAGSTSRDWRGSFEKRPWLILGLAFTAGCVAASLTSSGDSDDRYSSGDYPSSSDYSSSGDYSRSGGYSRSGSPSKSTYLSQTWSKMQSAFVVAVTRQAENFLEELVPGFREAYREDGHSDDNSNESKMQ